MTITVSVAIATYNGGEYLRQQLSSLANQTRLPDEVVISDDGSTDGTLDVIDSFRAAAPFQIVLLSNKGERGYAANFGSALNATKGDVVFLCDQDDYWFPEKIEYMLNYAVVGFGIVYNNAEFTDGVLKPSGVTKFEMLRKFGLFPHGMVMGCCAMVSRRVLEVALPIPARVAAHDSWLGKIAGAAFTVAYQERTLQFYRRHGENTSSFVANSYRLSSVDVVWSRMRSLIFGHGQIESHISKLEQDKLLFDRLAAVAQTRGVASESLQAYCLALKAEISLTEARVLIRKNGQPFNRLREALNLYVRIERYRLRNLLSDVLR